MYCSIQPKEIQEIEDCNIVQQTSYWAMVKDRQGLDPFAFEYNASKDLLHPGQSDRQMFHDDLLVLIRYIDHEHSYAYIPYGPRDEPVGEQHGLFLEELSEAIRDSLPEGCMFIRYDLPWKNQWANESDYFDDSGNWKGPPGSEMQEIRLNFNTRKHNLYKTQTNILPSTTIFLNLQNDPVRLLQSMKPKTRYNIRLSLKRGVKVKSCGNDQLELWYGLYSETARRNGITQHHPDYFESVYQTSLKADADVKIRLLLAEYQGQPLAGMFLAISGRRATYLYGASSRRMKNMMATYALQWKAIELAMEAGCNEYDMFGISPDPSPNHPMYGLYRFKGGFGGHPFYRMGCWDYPLMTKAYELFRAREVRAESYHL